MISRLLPSKILLTIYFWFAAAIGTIITSIVCLIIYPFASQKKFMEIYEYIIGYIILKLMVIPGFWSFSVIDLRTNKSFNNQYIFISNHSSFIDTLLTAQIPVTKRFIMAKKYSKIPLFGWLCIISGQVLVENSDETSRKEAFQTLIKSATDGISYMIYVEGTRSSDPYTLLDFKSGAFRLAQKTGIPIVPLVIRGAGTAMPVGGMCRPANLEIIIGDPIYITDIDEGIKKSRDFIKNYLVDIN